MAVIKLLSEELINKIAAGEVVQRPSSVVKELVENSLDSGATSILIEIKDSGKGMIRITDNGSGMDEEDARNSVLRHATSKIYQDDDLFAIETLGFRGEALASIAAVSLLSVITKQKDKLEGFNLVVEGGSILSSDVIAAEKGTIIEVCNLFFNTPARKKFLKTDAVELRHIIEVVTDFALGHKEISFRLMHERHQLLNAPSVENGNDNIASIYGVGVAKDLLEVNYQNEFVSISGYIGKPYQARNDKNQQVLLVNKRCVRNAEISKAVYNGYHSLLFVNKHPVFFLQLMINPKKIDVNVHPQKTEIKVEDIEEIQKAVSLAIEETLRQHNLIPMVDVEFETQSSFTQGKAKYAFEPTLQTKLQVKEAEAVMAGEVSDGFPEDRNVIGNNNDDDGDDDSVSYNNEVSYKEEVVEIPASLKFPEMKIMGQIHKTFFVAETPGGVFFLDQHATHERVLYERFMRQLMSHKVEVQNLLQGKMIELSSAEVVILKEQQDSLSQLGFELEHFEGNTFIVKTIPLVFGRLQPKETINHILNSLNTNSLEEVKEEIITRMACHTAIRAGEEISLSEMNNVIFELAKCVDPYTCPHGRPTMIKTMADELEKKFRRKG
jgi:DNA mismatch repair protein MutL